MEGCEESATESETKRCLVRLPCKSPCKAVIILAPIRTRKLDGCGNLTGRKDGDRCEVAKVTSEIDQKKVSKRVAKRDHSSDCANC